MPAMDPNTPPIGRQPVAYRVTPSKSQPWMGGIIGGDTSTGAVVGGERYTVQQRAELARRGIAAADVGVLLVKRQATRDDMWWPINSLPPVYAFECPVIGSYRGRVRVIAPNGDAKLVAPDGWAHRPFRTPRDQWGVA